MRGYLRKYACKMGTRGERSSLVSPLRVRAASPTRGEGEEHRSPLLISHAPHASLALPPRPIVARTVPATKPKQQQQGRKQHAKTHRRRCGRSRPRRHISGAAQAQISDDVVKIGVLTDMSSLYADATGKGSLAAVEMAVADYGGKVAGKPVQVVAADHQNKPDVGVNIARNWYDNDKVDAIFDVPTSSVALPISALTREKNKININSGGGSSDITGVAVLAQHRALDLRHLCAVERRRQGDGQARRGHLVLRHRRLRLRHGAAARRRQRGQGERRQGARRGPPSAQLVGLLLLPAAGPGLQGQGGRAGECRRRHHQRAEAGRRVRPRPRAARR